MSLSTVTSVLYSPPFTPTRHQDSFVLIPITIYLLNISSRNSLWPPFNWSVKQESDCVQILPNNALRFPVEVCTFDNKTITPVCYHSNNRGFIVVKFQPVPLYLLTNCCQPLADYILSFVNETFKRWDDPPTPIILNITFPCSYCQKTFPIKIFKNYLKEWRYGAIVESTQRVKGNFWHTAGSHCQPKNCFGRNIHEYWILYKRMIALSLSLSSCVSNCLLHPIYRSQKWR